nr:retrovirus-related Pol polyprotein from transposon 17.6 [Tanacetum cinerariifolium]
MVLLKKLPEKLEDPGKFLIPCNFSGMAEFLSLADLSRTGQSPNQSVSPKMSMKSFLNTGRALIHIFEGELTLHVGKEAIRFNLDQTSRYLANYNDMTANQINVIDMACEEYSQEVLGFFDVIMSGNPTPYYDPIVSTTYPTLTPFGESDFLLEEVDAFLALEDDPTLLKVNQCYVNTEGTFFCDDKLPIIIAKDLSVEKKTALITVLKSHKRVIAWKLSDIKGIHPEFYTHKILMEEDFKLAIQHQRKVNPKFHDVIKNEVLKLLDAGLIYPISDSPWYYCFLDGFSGYFQIPIDPKDQEMTTFTCPYRTFAYRRMPFGLCNAPGTFQRIAFQTCLSHLEKMLKRCKDTNLCLNWEKSDLMVKEGIVLGHKISKEGIEVDKGKVDVISKLPHPTTIKGIRSFLGHAGLY